MTLDLKEPVGRWPPDCRRSTSPSHWHPDSLSCERYGQSCWHNTTSIAATWHTVCRRVQLLVQCFSPTLPPCPRCVCGPPMIVCTAAAALVPPPSCHCRRWWSPLSPSLPCLLISLFSHSLKGLFSDSWWCSRIVLVNICFPSSTFSCFIFVVCNLYVWMLR